jgi:hypothetical protein
MSEPVLLVGVATSRPLAVWQARCVEQLAAVPGVRITRWLEKTPSRVDPPPAPTGPRSVGTVPEALTGLAPMNGDLAGLDSAMGDQRQRRVALAHPAPGGTAAGRSQPGGTGAHDPARSGTESGEAEPSDTVDVLLDLTAPGVDVPTWAREVWRFGYGRALTCEAARVAILDYTRSARMTRAALIREGDGAVIREGWLQTLTWWRGELLDQLLVDIASWPATAALEWIRPTADVDAGHSRDGPTPERRTLATLRDRLPMPVLLVGAVGRGMIETAISVLRQPDWNIGIIDAPIERLLSAGARPRITWLPSRPGHYAADPFAVERDGVLHVLFEDYDQAVGIGSIMHLSIAADGCVSVPEIAIETGVHTSYPFLLEHDGSIFMLPETAAAGELVLYEAEDFPRRWRRVATLLPGIPAVDASVVRHEGRWWMFATRSDHGDNHNLFVWHAPELLGPWTPHPANPVKTDIQSSRPGGTPFVVDGTLYRPAQDGSRIYGGRVVINRVDVLTGRAFREQPVASQAPQPGSRYPDGLHTLSGAGQRTLVDGNAMHLVRDALPRMLRRELRFRSRRPTPDGGGR